MGGNVDIDHLRYIWVGVGGCEGGEECKSINSGALSTSRDDSPLVRRRPTGYVFSWRLAFASSNRWYKRDAQMAC